MRWTLLIGGIVVIAGGIALAMTISSQVDPLRLLVDANTRLSGPEKQWLNEWLNCAPKCAFAMVAAGLVASLPYFALAQLINARSQDSDRP